MIFIQDTENISLKQTKKILNKLNLNTEIKEYISISKIKISEKQKEYVNDINFKFVYSNKDADSLLKFCLKIKQENNDTFIIVSSDSDFVEIVKELLKNDKKVIWVVNHKQSKRILMKSSLIEKNLKILLFDFKKEKS